MKLSWVTRILALLCLIAALVPAFAVIPSNETMLAHAFIPSPGNVHGETRLLKRGDTACVQTILHSASFRRGVREIQLRETDAWSRNQPGVEDSVKYRDELEKAKTVVLDEPRIEADVGRPYTMLMEFSFLPGKCTIELFKAEVERGGATFLIKNQSLISSLPVSDRYMSRALLLMTAAAFSSHRKDSLSLLESAGWVDLSPAIPVESPAPLR